MSEKTQIPLPAPTPISSPHWEGARKDRLRVQRCRSCEQHIFIPQPTCTQCLSGELEWVESSGKGELYSYTVVHRPQQPAFETPYTVVIVQLEEGFFMLSNLIDCEETDISIGMPLEVVFEKMSNEISLPYFRPRAVSN
ncbi:MAG: Zn-ribbon domain-containing OB-fold protein [Myxococcota bacterium]|nr:Zn-ribbon domain-containing OB-fold protein [Myxococcota bacterium]